MSIMSDGKSNGIALMYVRDGIVYPVALKKEQVEMLDAMLGMVLGGKLTVLEDHPQGKLLSLKEVCNK